MTQDKNRNVTPRKHRYFPFIVYHVTKIQWRPLCNRSFLVGQDKVTAVMYLLGNRDQSNEKMWGPKIKFVTDYPVEYAQRQQKQHNAPFFSWTLLEPTDGHWISS